MADKLLMLSNCVDMPKHRSRMRRNSAGWWLGSNAARGLLWAMLVCWSPITALSSDASDTIDLVTERSSAAYPKNLIRIGAYRFFVNDVADDLVGVFTPPNASANVGDTTSFALSYARFLSENISIQISAGYPPKFDVAGSGSIASLGKIVSVTALNPTVFLNYHFFDARSDVRPYVGVGVNYTNFVDEQPSSSLEVGLGGNTAISLSSFVALAVTAGVDIKLEGSWVASISASYLSADTTATITTGGLDRTMDIELDPVTVFVGLGYQY